MLFSAVLTKLESEKWRGPTAWEEHNLFEALGAMSRNDLDGAEQLLIRCNRPPTAQEIASLSWTRRRLSTAEIRNRFDTLSSAMT